ncbi:MAG: urease accessory protein UreE [Cyanobacteria bacterium Co-bin8]|nr:urease accessory protein UreE [Cyanobacteria bacterium Co-bin8]
MHILIHRLSSDPAAAVVATLSLTAAERVRSRHHFTADDGQPIYLRLPRGTVLQDQDLLAAEDGSLIRVLAKPEPVLTVTADNPLQLLRAAYHLGNRHIALEVAPEYLRLEPDPVLEDMLHQLGLEVKAEFAPFVPEAGAYSHSHAAPHPSTPQPAHSSTPHTHD